MLRIICVASLLLSQIALVAADELKPGVRGLAARLSRRYSRQRNRSRRAKDAVRRRGRIQVAVGELSQLQAGCERSDRAGRRTVLQRWWDSRRSHVCLRQPALRPAAGGSRADSTCRKAGAGALEAMRRG